MDFNSPDIDSVSLCNLALETSALFAESNFLNTDLMIRAIAYFLESIEIDSRNYKAHLGLGLILTSGRLYKQAIEHLEAAYAINPVPDINKYIKLAEEGISSQKSAVVETAITTKKNTVDDLLDLGNKFKIK